MLKWTEEDEKDFLRKEKEYLDRPLQKVDQKTFLEMLEVLPPLIWKSSKAEFPTEQSTEFFLMSEFTFGNITEEYYKLNENEFYCKYVNACDRSTWISLTDIYNLKQQAKV